MTKQSKTRRHSPGWTTCEFCKKTRFCYGKRFCSKKCADLFFSGASADFLKEVEQSSCPTLPEMPGEFVLESDFLIIVNDVHCPLHSIPWATRVAEVALKYEKEAGKKADLMVGGDLTDNEFLSSHPGEKRESAIAQCLDSTAKLLQAWFAVVGRFYYLQGNHEARLSKRYGGLSFSELWRMIEGRMECRLTHEKIFISPRNTATANGSWYLWHPHKAYSKIRTKLAQEAATKKKMNTIVFHQHHPGGWTRCEQNKYFAVDSPPLVDDKQILYKAINEDPRYPSCGVGFTVLYRIDGVTHFRLFTEGTDWKSVLYTEGVKFWEVGP